MVQVIGEIHSVRLLARKRSLDVWSAPLTATMPQVKQLIIIQERTHTQPYPPSGGSSFAVSPPLALNASELSQSCVAGMLYCGKVPIKTLLIAKTYRSKAWREKINEWSLSSTLTKIATLPSSATLQLLKPRGKDGRGCFND